ncbi:hypothetical protein DMC01_11200 [Campylobacter troglodytis]|nr:hypothetical protein DMC01_11200 [Campylobacter troglodytis]
MFEEYLILEYRIFGNIKLNRDNLALMKTAPFEKTMNLSFVRPVIFDTSKHIFYDRYLVAYFCLQFNKFGMNNISVLLKDLDSKMGYSVDKIISRGHRNWIYAFRYPLSKDKK